MNYKHVIPMLICSLALFSGCSSKSAKTSAPAEKAISVKVFNVEKTTIKNVNTIVGKVKPEQDITVVSKSAGRAGKVFVNIGDKVKKGQPLFALEEKDINLQVTQAEAALNSAKANLDRTKGGSMELQLSQLKTSLSTSEINLKDSKTSYENTKALYEINAVSKQTLDTAETKYNVALEQYNSAKKSVELTESQINGENITAAETQVKQAQAAYDISKSQLDNITIVSPIDGIVSSRSVNEGEMVSSAVAAFGIVDISNVIVEINVLEDMVNVISEGNSYDVYIKSLNEKPYTGKVIGISPNANSKTQTYLVRLSIENTDGKLKGGMLADVKVVTNSKQNAIAVPIDAVIDDGGKKVVYIVNGEEAQRKEVTTGAFDEKIIEISGDVKANDKVIIKGQNFLKDKTKVVVVE